MSATVFHVLVTLGAAAFGAGLGYAAGVMHALKKKLDLEK